MPSVREDRSLLKHCGILGLHSPLCSKAFRYIYPPWLAKNSPHYSSKMKISELSAVDTRHRKQRSLPKTNFCQSGWKFNWAVILHGIPLETRVKKSKRTVRCRGEWQQNWTWQQVNTYLEEYLTTCPQRYATHVTTIGVPANSRWDLCCTLK